MNKTVFFVVALISFNLSAQTTYYVSLSGDDTDNGLTESTAWRTIGYAASSSSPVTAGDTVYIKTGDYGNDNVNVEKNYDVNDARISFIGYQNVPGDISNFNFVYGDQVDASVMPLINPGDRNLDVGINLYDTYSITIKNIQIANSYAGIYVYNGTAINSNLIFENIFLQNIGWEYATAIYMSEANNNNIRNCLIVNATGAGMDISGDNNHIENCKIYSNESQPVPDGTYTSMDYYIAIKGSNNIVQNCYAERDGELADVGHGFEIKESGQHNLFVDCTVKNMIAGCFSVRWSGVQNNEFRNCHALGGISDDVSAFMIRDGASNNTFNACFSDVCQAGVRFEMAGEDANYCGHNNHFNNCLITNSEWAIDLNDYQYNSYPANDNIFANCIIDQSNYLFKCDRPNTGNQLVNCIVTNVSNWTTGGNTPNFVCTYSDFYNNGFSIPSGTGNISDDPLFVNASGGDYHLIETSPCIDSGTSQNAPLVDFEGVNRPQNAGFDMGIYEYQSLGTDEYSIDKIKIFPNPTIGKIYFSNAYLYRTYDIVSSTGKIVQYGFLMENHIDLSSLKTGVYHIVILGSNTKGTTVIKK